MLKKIRERQKDMFETAVEDLVRKDHPHKKLLTSINLKQPYKPLHYLMKKEDNPVTTQNLNLEL